MVAHSKGSRIILTTREHILRHAFQLSEEFRRQQKELITQKFIRDVKNYSLLERGRILYNHIYFSDLPFEYRNQLLADRFYPKVLRHRNFNPRVVEWLSNNANIKSTPAHRFRNAVQ